MTIGGACEESEVAQLTALFKLSRVAFCKEMVLAATCACAASLGECSRHAGRPYKNRSSASAPSCGREHN